MYLFPPFSQLLSVPQHDTSSSTADKPTVRRPAFPSSAGPKMFSHQADFFFLLMLQAKRTKSKAAERKKTKATASARKLREENPTRRCVFPSSFNTLHSMSMPC